jgi:diguanylate cyclase (GGDEF)-like protein
VHEFLSPRTIALAVVIIALTTGALLLVSSRQNNDQNSLVTWGIANILGGIGVVMVSLRGFVPDMFTIVIGNALIVLCYSLNAKGTLDFCRRKVAWGWVAAPAGLWLALCLWPAFISSVEWRLIVGSGLVAAASFTAAIALWTLRDEHLVTRKPAAFWLFCHGVIFTIRMIPPFISTVPASNEIAASPIMTLIMLESLVHVTLISFLQLSLIKDRAEERYRRAAETDVLTGQPNRRAFMDRADRVVSDSDHWPACMLVIDVDRFKAINDSVGHSGGDAVLVKVAETIRSHLRSTDTFGRIGGEEFAALLPNTTLQSAAVIAEGLRARIAGLAIHAAGETVHVSISIGVSAIAGGKPDLDHLIDRADACLYEAKRTGRNRVVAREDGMRLAG